MSAGRGNRTAQPMKYSLWKALTGFSDLRSGLLSPVDRRAARRGRRTTVDEQFLALYMRGIVGSEKQHGLRNVIRFTHAPERCASPDALFEGLLGFRRRQRGAPDRGADRARRNDVDADIARRQF